jgi:indole-3-glycerol phosphate synthase
MGATAKCLQTCGAAAISVLTEGDFFGGSLDDLADARRAVALPLLRKDFIVDKIQIAEAKAFGADAVLLIAALLPDNQLEEFVEFASSLRIDALVEIHDEPELGRAVDAGATIIGVNNRNLQTMTIDLSAGARLLQLIPDRCLRVAESGLRTRADVLMMRDSGANAFLIGTAVMLADDMETAIRKLMGS